ncbi:UDP-N-acetylmuramoylalanine--D-glutamate ligase [Sphingomonas sp. LH128]|uniref:UDP-N-acetylmuramoylalanine--D-glutamate ligase n=1 Tax=Novosphingobium resinovorum TaxID=158500 RepID=A0A031JUE4_9SPHN|nr:MULTISPECIES: UDP-N-acetylmuramoyl-L-alanine--D-glutamate ligase [Sphingomonadaceae]AOR77001.1 UDP-N-acetylmuramoylalanine--D-glutamate ligase [Novosphingobium resinovorum]EJU12491.1 UDP-N-acetylmuramoylalanine--D-glutamate ligase [Sphingomonas sp. LH128]EZP81361.1 UDP-N-acetylmuramoylalanine--D-glutamate ligase [Novosphingobium resinovorum]
MIVSPIFAGKRYAVLGLARSGLTAVATLVESGAHVMAWDSRDEARQQLCEWTDCGKVELADPVSADITGYDGVVVSPGIPLNRHPIAEAAERAGVPVIGDIELFALARASLPAHRVVGITGTNGKSTTTSLVCHLLEVAGVPARAGGNIGVPVLGPEPLPEGGVYVLELSSYQIDITRSLDCDVAALLNITPDHLDRYDGFEAYAASKGRLFSMQGRERQAVFGVGDKETRSIAHIEAARRAPGLVRFADGADLVEIQKEWPSLQGPHNLQNAAVAVAIVEALGVKKAQWRKGLRTFSGLPHRMERVAVANGVTYINDSKATNPASTAPAIAAFPPDPEPRIHWILGGLPKGDNLDECKPFFGNIAAAYTIGDAGPLFAEILSPYTQVHRSEMMAEAIRQAMAAAKPGDVVMLSPACASFDQFRDYEARGDVFRQIVEALLAENAKGEQD